jgi:hypothetical protein
MVPREHAGKAMLGLVRNPWSYYVSWYAFQSGRRTQNALFRLLSDGGRHGFEGTIRGMLELGNGSPLLKPIVAALPGAYGGNGINLPGFALASIEGSKLGFYSFLYRYMYAGEPPAAIGQMERLREDFPLLLANAGFTPSAAMSAFIANQAPLNVSEHRPYQSYYGAALRDLVAERDAAVIGAHGYTFD